MYPDGPMGGIWSVRPVGADGRSKNERENETEQRGVLKRRRHSRDSVTLSAEARKLSLAEKGQAEAQTPDLPVEAIANQEKND